MSRNDTNFDIWVAFEVKGDKFSSCGIAARESRMAHQTKAQKLRQRREVKVWYPRPSDLVLPDVPASERGQVRKFLGWLGKLPIRAGACWQTAKAVTLLARDSRIQYVEGVYYLAESALDGPMSKPYPHAWNLVNGHIVDLLTEFHNWRFGGEDKWLHEPLKVYSLEDIGGVSGGNFSIFQKVWMDEHEDRKSESMAAICEHVFKEAIDKQSW
jgi:hypothetical protein